LGFGTKGAASRVEGPIVEVKHLGQPAMVKLERNWPLQPKSIVDAKCIYVYTGFENWMTKKTKKNECMLMSGTTYDKRPTTPEFAQVLVARKS
jgi:hypothetical protein